MSEARSPSVRIHGSLPVVQPQCRPFCAYPRLTGNLIPKCSQNTLRASNPFPRQPISALERLAKMTARRRGTQVSRVSELQARPNVQTPSNFNRKASVPVEQITVLLSVDTRPEPGATPHIQARLLLRGGQREFRALMNHDRLVTRSWPTATLSQTLLQGRPEGQTDHALAVLRTRPSLQRSPVLRLGGHQPGERRARVQRQEYRLLSPLQLYHHTGLAAEQQVHEEPRS